MSKTAGPAAAAKKLQCDMKSDCTHEVTHIGEKGYIYCTEHMAHRKGTERCRKLRKWELALLREGKPLPSYKPIPRSLSLSWRGRFLLPVNA